MPRLRISLPPQTKWPEAAPRKGEDSIFSIVCGNSHIQWAIHEGEGSRFNPTLFWRTPQLTDDDFIATPCELLSSYVPEMIHSLIFDGEGAPATKESAERASFKRKFPKFRVFVISSNETQAKYVNTIWKDVPSKVYLMKGNDFFTQDQGRYETMGVDRAAALLAAIRLYGSPALVFDGGTAMTYTAADGEGKVMGGGISLGLGAKLKTLADATCGPNIKAAEARKLATEVGILGMSPTQKQLFHSDTKQAIASSSFGEVSNNAKQVIQTWLEKVGPASVAAEDETGKTTGLTTEDTAKDAGAASLPISDADKSGGGGPSVVEQSQDQASDGTNPERVVLVTGGDADILMQLLGPADGVGYKLRKVKNMVHYGVAQLLNEKAKMKQSELNLLKDTYDGLRVAKKFGTDVFRGTIHSLKTARTRTEDLFKIKYDDGDSEDLDVQEVYDALMLYVKVGEKAKDSVDADLVNGKRKAAAAAAELLEPTLKKFKAETASPTKKSAAPEPDKETASPTQKSAAPEPDKETASPTKKSAAPEPDKETASQTKKSAEPKPDKAEKKRPAPPQDSESNPTKKPKPDPRSYIDKRVAKDFGGEVYFGTIDGYEPPTESEEELWHVVYDDGDQEHMDEVEVTNGLALKSQHKDPKS